MTYSASVWTADDCGAYQWATSFEGIEADDHAFAAELVWTIMMRQGQPDRPAMSICDVIVVTDDETEEEQSHEIDFVGTKLVEHPDGRTTFDGIEADERTEHAGTTVHSGAGSSDIPGQGSAPSVGGEGPPERHNRRGTRRTGAGKDASAQAERERSRNRTPTAPSGDGGSGKDRAPRRPSLPRV